MVSEIFEEYKADTVNLIDLRKKIAFHKLRYKNCISLELKTHHKEFCNAFVDEQKKLYKPIRDFVKYVNKIKKHN